MSKTSKLHLVYEVKVSVKVPTDVWESMADTIDEGDELLESLDNIDLIELIRTQVAFDTGNEELAKKLYISIE